MTRNLDRQEYLPGWIWSVLHILDYHYWHSSRKISERRKNRRGKHTVCCGYPKTISFEHYADEAHEYLNADAVPLIDEQKTLDANPANRDSAKAHIKAVISEEMFARSQIQHTDSFRHLRSSNSLCNPIIILDKSADKLVNPSLKRNNSDSTKLNREISDVLDIFKINKNMFLEILQDPDVQLTSNSKARLRKSGSFPLPSSPDHRHLKPSTLEHKSREIWSFRKGENFNEEIEVTQSIESQSLENFLQMPKNVQANDTVVLAVSEESGLNKHGRHNSFMGHLKRMMKKIKHGLKERRRRNNQIFTASLSHRVSSISSLSTDKKDIDLDGSESRTVCNERSISSKDLRHMRRVSSLNESMDRYGRLFEWHERKSKSLRLTNEGKNLESGYRIKSFKRRLSLKDPEAIQSEIPIKKEIHSDSNILRTLVDVENLEKNEFPVDCIERNNEEITNAKELHDPEKYRHGDPCQDQDPEKLEEASHVSVLEPCIEDHIADQTNFSDLIGSELDCRHISSVNLQDEYRENEENAPIEEVDDADFNYVQDVLELCGLIQHGYLGSWHSLDQPLSPTLFKELEVYLHQELEISSDDVCCNHRLLFDSINEVLLHMYASSLAYFPKNFSFGQRVRPLPKGSRVVEAVWKRISSKSKMDQQSLDDIVARDLAKDDSWLELQLDMEDIALDLEEWIFDELVDEIMCS